VSDAHNESFQLVGENEIKEAESQLSRVETLCWNKSLEEDDTADGNQKDKLALIR